MPTLHLLEIAGYAGNSDERLEELTSELEDPNCRIECIGGYPVPPVYEKRTGTGKQAVRKPAARERKRA